MRLIVNNLPVVEKFRGQLAPASLKRIFHAEVAITKHEFRGQLAPASLKHAAWWSNRHGYSLIPGPIGPGLIEAWVWLP